VNSFLIRATQFLVRASYARFFQSQLMVETSLSHSLAQGRRSLIASKGECSLHPNCGELTLAPKN
jgi:hypothetical protein